MKSESSNFVTFSREKTKLFVLYFWQNPVCYEIKRLFGSFLIKGQYHNLPSKRYDFFKWRLVYRLAETYFVTHAIFGMCYWASAYCRLRHATASVRGAPMSRITACSLDLNIFLYNFDTPLRWLVSLCPNLKLFQCISAYFFNI